MGRAELERAKWESQRWAEAYEAQERELRDLAASCEGQWQQKTEQLELARAALSACTTAHSSQEIFSRDVETFASKVASALAESSARQGIVSTVRDAAGYAKGAVSEARRLVESLEKECNSLRASTDDYNGRADTAGASARECWDDVSRLQWEIDICQE